MIILKVISRHGEYCANKFSTNSYMLLKLFILLFFFQPKPNKAEAKGSEFNVQTVRPFLPNFPSPNAANNDKGRQPVTTPPLSQTSSGIGTDSSAVSPTESPSQDDAEWRNSEDNIINVVDNSSTCSPNSGKTQKLFSADSSFLSGGPDISNSSLPPQNNANVFTGNLEKFLASTKQVEVPPDEDSETDTEDLDPGAPKRPRSRYVCLFV